MKPFTYIAARTVDEAVTALHEHGAEARVLAGGTDLLIEWRQKAARVPRVVVDISRIASLRGISSGPEIVSVGTLTTHAEIACSDQIRARAPFLAAAASSIGSPQIRNRGTLGGNIMNAAACADLVPPLIALDASAALASAEGERQCHLSGFFVKPYATAARADELMTAVTFPLLSPSVRCAFLKLGRRNALSITRLSVAAVIALDPSGNIVDARIVPGAAFATWRRAAEAENLLIGNPPGRELYARAGRAVADELVRETGTRWSSEYKLPVIAALVRRALEKCCLVND